ncbi:MAG: hypothetical protein AB7G88_04035, partial [Thermomicrobiales bacterium]
DAVASMGDAAGLDTADAFHSLEELVDSGLLEREPEADRGPRFRMLETIREYGIDQLIEHSELEDAHSAFAEYIYEFVARGAPVPNGAFDPAWQTRIEAEDANVDAAFEWLCHPEHAAKAIEFCAEIGMYWEYRGPWGVAAGRMQKAINLASLEPSLATTKALYWTAGLAMCTGDLARAKETGDIALRMARALGDPRAVAYSLATLAWNAELAEEWDVATNLFEQALELFVELEEIGTQGQMLAFLGRLAYIRGDYANARRMEEKAASIFAGGSANEWLAVAEWRLGFIDLAEHKWHDAALKALGALEIWLTVPTRTHLFKPIILIAEVASAIGVHEAAAALLGCADHLLEKNGGILLSDDRPAWERATESSSMALGDVRFGELHASARALGPADWLRLADDVARRAASFPDGSAPVIPGRTVAH